MDFITFPSATSVALTGEHLWSHDLSRKTFHQWFDLHYHSTVCDLSKTPVTVDDPELDAGDHDPSYR